MPPRRELIPEPTAMEMICQFNKLKPPKFEGGTNPMAYEEWLRRMENLFEIMECPEGFKVHLATYQFKKEAEFWWGTVKPRAGEPALTWNQLKALMDAQYYSHDVRRIKEREFLCLMQGEMSITEYAAKFNELSRFAPNQVATEEMRMDHFEQGLRGEIKQIIAGYAYANFQEMYQRAVKVARIIDETKNENKEKGRARKEIGPRESNSQGCKDFRRFKSGIEHHKGKQTVQWKLRTTCGQCGRQHPGPCRSFTGSCFECGNAGHKAANCPRAKWNNQGNIQSSEMRINPMAQQGRSSIRASSENHRNRKKPQAGGRAS